MLKLPLCFFNSLLIFRKIMSCKRKYFLIYYLNSHRKLWGKFWFPGSCRVCKEATMVAQTVWAGIWTLHWKIQRSNPAVNWRGYWMVSVLVHFSLVHLAFISSWELLSKDFPLNPPSKHSKNFPVSLMHDLVIGTIFFSQWKHINIAGSWHSSEDGIWDALIPVHTLGFSRWWLMYLGSCY